MKNSTINFEPNGFYPKKQIWKAFGVSNRGGIRINKRKNLLVLFFDASHHSNIYDDYFDHSKGLFHFTGSGQKGNQTLASKGNYWLHNAKKNDTKIHFFWQHDLGLIHQYVGEVEVVATSKETQPDANQKPREVYIFWLRPISNITVTEEGSLSREIEFELSQEGPSSKTIQELEKEISELNKKIKKTRSNTKVTIKT